MFYSIFKILQLSQTGQIYKYLTNYIINICVSSLNFILFWKFLSVDVVLEPKKFCSLWGLNSQHRVQCSEPSVIPLSNPGAPSENHLRDNGFCRSAPPTPALPPRSEISNSSGKKANPNAGPMSGSGTNLANPFLAVTENGALNND